MAKMDKAWNDADANQDGMLDLAEYRVFYATLKAISVEEGNYVDAEDLSEEQYNILNSISADGDGVSRGDLRAFMGPYQAKWQELKQQAGL